MESKSGEYAFHNFVGYVQLWNSEDEEEDKVINPECFRITTEEISVQENPARCIIQQVHHKEVISPFIVSKMFGRDFSEGERHSRALSQEDKRFLENMKGGIHLTEDHHYEIPLPFRRDETELSSNRTTAETLLHRLKRRFTRNNTNRTVYLLWTKW